MTRLHPVCAATVAAATSALGKQLRAKVIDIEGNQIRAVNGRPER